jgi:hypothetical protein
LAVGERNRWRLNIHGVYRLAMVGYTARPQSGASVACRPGRAALEISEYPPHGAVEHNLGGRNKKAAMNAFRSPLSIGWFFVIHFAYASELPWR